MRLRAELAARGFLWAAVDDTAWNVARGVAVQLRVRTGPRARVGAVELTGDAVTIPALSADRGRPFTGALLDRQVGVVLDFYSERGYPFCRVQADRFQVRGTALDYRLEVATGPFVIVSDVDITGRFQTRPAVIRRQFGYPRNTPYRDAFVRRGVRRLTADGALQVVARHIAAAADGYRLVLEVVEHGASQVDAAVSYLPSGRELVGRADLSLGNLGGSRRRADLHWQHVPGHTTYGLAYTEPWLLGQNLSGRLALEHQGYDTAYAATSLWSGLRLPFADLSSVAFELGAERTAPVGVPAGITVWAGSGVAWEGRDVPADPTRGLALAIASRLGQRPSGRFQVRSMLDVEGVLPLGARWGIAVGVHGRDVTSADSIAYYDRFALGGSASVRGYREDAVRALRMAWANGEFGLRVGTARVLAFIDAGLHDAGTAPLLVGYGLGVRTRTALGIVSIDYGIARGENVLGGKLHLRYGRGF